jgi:drug/metabolite transporter (DMT)-like permease
MSCDSSQLLVLLYQGRMQTQNHRAPALEFALVLLLGLLWGSPYALTKIALASIPAVTLVAARVFLAAAVLWLVVGIRQQRVPTDPRFAARVFLQGILCCVVPYTLITYGQQTVESSLAAILNSTIPLIVFLISALWTHHEPITTRRLFGIVIGFGGVILLIGLNAFFALDQHLVGEAAIMLATICSAVSVIYGRRFASVAPEVVAAGMLTAASIVLVPMALILESPWHLTPSAPSLAALAVNAIVATGLGFTLYFRLIRTVGTMGTASTSYLKPAVGVLIGHVFLGEPLTWVTLAGLAAILIGVAAINSEPIGRFGTGGSSRTQRFDDLSNPAI